MFSQIIPKIQYFSEYFFFKLHIFFDMAFSSALSPLARNIRAGLALEPTELASSTKLNL
jgi:hypothetical protein